MAAARETRTISSGDAELCTESIGDPDDPTILLLGGGSASMDWWEDDFCELLAARGRRVIRFDYRDTGQSTTYGAGAAEYTGDDFVADVIAILDAFELPSAHLAGLSMGGAISQVVGLLHRDRVATLTLLSTSLAVGGEGLPGMAPELEAFFGAETPDLDWGDREAAIERMVENERPFAGAADFDEERMRSLAARVYDRSDDPASASNHFAVVDDDTHGRTLDELAGIPTLVIHGTADPMFPGHGAALAEAIPGARLMELDGVGHEYPPPRVWDEVVEALVEHTAG